jgi:hypothetical protein
VLAIAVTGPSLARSALLNDFRDNQYLTLFEEAARLSVGRFHQLPLWDPYYCGGVYGLGTAQARWASPTFLFTLIFGTLRGGALTTMAMTLLGLEGTFRYLRLRGAGTLPSMMSAPVFALSGLFAHAFTLGWTNFFGFELVPWALYGIHKALAGERRGLVVAALAIAWMIGFGGTYTGPLTVLAASIEVVEALAYRIGAPRTVRGSLWSMGRVLFMGVLVVLLAGALSIVRLWPVGETLSASPRIIGGAPGEVPRHVWELLFGDRGRRFTRADFFVGIPVIPLIVLGSGRRRALALTFSGLVWVWLAFGFKAPWKLSLFGLLRAIPPYTMLRAPERFLILVALGIAGISALGLRRLEAAARKQTWMIVAMLPLYLLLVTDSAMLIGNAWAEAFSRPMVTAPTVLKRDFRQARGNRWLAAYYPFMSRGSLSCFDDYDVAQSPDLRGDLAQEEYLADPAAGTVTRRAWSPDRIDLEVDLRTKGRLMINQNWHPGWHASSGEVVNANGLIAVDLPAGQREVTLEFLPRSAVGGGLALVVGLAAAFVLWRWGERTPWIATWRDGLGALALCLSPFAAGLLAFPFVNEAARPPPAYLTPTGDPMIVDAPPPESTPIGAVWQNGIKLEAAGVHIEPAGDGQSVLATLELDWRMDTKVESGLGVFVHFETSPKERFSADHVLLSNTMLPEDVPLHETIRDVAGPIVVSLGKNAVQWNVYIGLWHARLDQTRIPIAEGKDRIGGGEQRILVASFEVPAKEEPKERSETRDDRDSR